MTGCKITGSVTTPDIEKLINQPLKMKTTQEKNLVLPNMISFTLQLTTRKNKRHYDSIIATCRNWSHKILLSSPYLSHKKQVQTQAQSN